ncbi:ABC transporter permease [Mumia sp. ZJ1417]|uniref:ABC transporter permease n=1 Tax=unclassified Mumia TaxID=2621872 RepID=UPI00141EAB12|nr:MULTISPECIES: ABC transporter permease [unclassified Mumia]QMW65380.1 ABC transporter permease [Mumia sp. ZJ1417]
MPAPRRRGRLGPGGGGWTLVVPLVLFLGVFFLYPLVQMARESASGGLATYEAIMTSPVYRKVFANTLTIAGATTLLCLVLAYPYAYVMNKVSPRLRLALMAFVLLPFWASLLVRSFAWIALLQDSGLINQALQGLGITDDPVSLIRTTPGVLIGMVHIMLPYMVLPLYTAMARVDGRLLLAASSLGATPWRRFVRVFLPLTLPGLAAGCLLVFTISLGFYITPALLGAPSQAMLGEVIAEQVEQFGLTTASALGIVLLTGTLIILMVVALFAKRLGRASR